MMDFFKKEGKGVSSSYIGITKDMNDSVVLPLLLGL